MSGLQTQSNKFDQLRRQAEALIRHRPDAPSEIPSDILDLIHELKIYQAELEIQNEELKRAQQEISELKQDYEDLYEFAPCGYLTLNAKGVITRANLTAVSLLETPRRFLVHSGLSQFIADGWGHIYQAARQKVIETGKRSCTDLKLKTKNGSQVWIRADIEAALDETGAVDQWRMVLVNITAQRQAEEEKKKIEEELRQSQKMETIGTLAGGIAHEFNNLLYVIMGNNELLQEDFPEQGSSIKRMKEIQKACLRARDIVRLLLTFGNKDDAPKKVMNIVPAVRESIKIIRTLTPAYIEIEQTVPDDIDLVFANQTQLHQVIINLCSNARDALLMTGGRITIEMCNETLDEKAAGIYPQLKSGRHVKLIVRDNGCGIDRENLEKIFDPYFTTKAMDRGTGIGLAVVYGIVKNHNGVIYAESELNQGTVFTVLLPACDGKSSKKYEKKSRRPKGNETLLFVDDEPSILKLGKQRLERLGYTVMGYTDPLEALEMFKAAPKRFDMVVTDMAMPGLTGDQLIYEILKIRPKMPTMLCTGFSEKISKETAYEIGICSFAMKPISADEFAACVRKALDESLEFTCGSSEF